MGLLTMWLLYSAFGVTIFSLLFVWAVRTRQFSDQERARHLALWSPGEGAERAGDPSTALGVNTLPPDMVAGSGDPTPQHKDG